MAIGDICNRNMAIVQGEESVTAAAKLMRRHRTGTAVVVYDKGGQCVPIGMLTDRDIVVDVIAEDVALDSTTVGEIMSRDLWAMNIDDDIGEVLRTMQRQDLRCVPVVNDDGSLVGIVTLDDLFELLSSQLGDVGVLINREVQKKALPDPLAGNSGAIL